MKMLPLKMIILGDHRTLTAHRATVRALRTRWIFTEK